MSRFQGISCSVLRDTLSKLIWRDVLWVIEAERQTYQEGKEERDVMRKFDTAGTALRTIMAGLSGRKWTGLLSYNLKGMQCYELIPGKSSPIRCAEVEVLLRTNPLEPYKSKFGHLLDFESYSTFRNQAD
jgi:hypothetical protein